MRWNNQIDPALPVSFPLGATPHIALIGQILPPYAAGAPLHHHPDHAERCSVLHGTLALTIAERTIMLQAGAAATIPRRVPHTLWNPTPGTTILLLIFTPGAAKIALRRLAAGEPIPPPEPDPFLRYLARP
jgi:hypothetical protein